MEKKLACITLAMGLASVSALSASAGVVNVPGTNGANGVISRSGSVGGTGGAAIATTATPSDPSNAATATGGNGGNGTPSFVRFCGGLGVGGCIRFPPYPGGAGGAAVSTATTSVLSGGALAKASAFGGKGGAGGAGAPAGAGGNGGAASATASATTSGTGTAQAVASATGGAGGSGAAIGAGGNAHASASAQNSSGRAATTASAPGGGPASAIATANVGVGGALVAGRVVSAAALTSTGGDGLMDAAYGGSGQGLQYEATALFDFTTRATETLDLNLASDTFSGIGFDSLKLLLVVDGISHLYSFTSLATAEPFFSKHPLDLGSFAGGNQSVSLDYFLIFNSATKATDAAGFEFAYNFAMEPTVGALALAAPRSIAVPEASTWVMMLVGLASLGWVGSGRPRRRGGVVKGGRTSPISSV